MLAGHPVDYLDTLDLRALLDVLFASFVDAVTPGIVAPWEVLGKVDELLDECPIVTTETWGTSQRARRGYRVAELEAGGPAPMRKDQRES